MKFIELPPRTTRHIAVESVKSLFIEMLFDETLLSTGTGFICHGHSGRPALITNWHNVTGRHIETKALIDTKHAAIPNRIRIHHNLHQQLGMKVATIEPLLDPSGAALWLEHPLSNERFDLVALPLTNLADVQLYPYNPNDGSDMRVSVAAQASVIGFPFGIHANQTAVWATGFIASEPEIDYQGLPMFLGYAEKGPPIAPVMR